MSLRCERDSTGWTTYIDGYDAEIARRNIGKFNWTLNESDHTLEPNISAMIEDVVRRLVDYERKLEDEVVQTLVIDWLRQNGWKVERDG